MTTISIVEDEFGTTLQPSTLDTEVVKRFTFKNENGFVVQVITYGATITSIKVPNKNGIVDDVVLGYDDMEGYLSSTNPYFGATVGRVCNRISKGQFYLNGKEYKLAKNINGSDHLHGGFIGFDKFNWTAFVNGNKVIMTHVNSDGFEGYPGTVIANATFELTDDNRFICLLTANTSRPTPINLTNHSYFNLAGHKTGFKEIYKHSVAINADKYTFTSDASIPTGEIRNVAGTPFDLRKRQDLGEAITHSAGFGFDDNYCVTRGTDQSLNFVAEVFHQESGRILEVYSDQPGVQFYTSNWMPDPENNIYPTGKARLGKAPNGNKAIHGKDGAVYTKHSAFCLETQKYPDAVNHENFPSVILNPGDTYKHTIVYKFNTEPIIEMVTL